MQKTKNNYNKERDILLNLILVFRILPLNWIYQTYKDFGLEKNKVWDIVKNLKFSNDVKVKKDISSDKLILLTKKGFRRAVSNGITIANYRDWSKVKSRAYNIRNEHNFILFKFLTKYFIHNQNISLAFTEYDNKCKLDFSGINNKYFIKPDALIIPTDKKESMIGVEADTHIEPQAKLYDKLLKYILAGENYYEIDNLNHLKVYFVFKSEQRAQSVFSQEGVIRMFSDLNTFKTIKIKLDITIRQILKILKEGRLQIFSGLYSYPINDYKQIDLAKLLREKEKRWKKL